MSIGLARIVAATDFSDHAGKAVRRAAMLASQHKVELELLHVVSRSSLDAVRNWVRTPGDVADRLVEDARHLLHESAASLGTPASPRLAVGDVTGEILSSCARGRVLAVGARGLSPLRDALLGTTAERLAGRCECPILVVRKEAGAEYRNILVAVDLLPGSESVLAMAAAIAPGAKMAAVHAYEVPFETALQRAGVSMEDIDTHRAAAFDKAHRSIRALSETVLPIVDRGHAARLILEHAHGLAADLVVIGKRRRSAAETLLLGSTTRHVLADSDCDVLVVSIEA